MFYFILQEKKTDKDITLCLDNKSVCQTDSVKYLGVLIDSNLSWKSHIHELSKKIAKTVGILSKLRYYASTDILISVYYALIRSFLIYGIEVRSQTYPHLKPISTLQKKAIRIITFSETHPRSEPLFKSLNIVKFLDLADLHILKLQLPSCFYDF